MKLHPAILLSAALLCANGYAQTSGAGGTGTGGTTTPGAPSTGTRSTQPPLPPGGQPPPQQPGNPNVPQNPNAPQNPNTPQPGQVSSGQNSQFVGTNAATPPGVDTNQLAANTNQFGTNRFGTNLLPTSTPGFTNRIMSTNSPLMHDQALSESDRRLLAQLRTAVYGASQRPPPLGGTVVNFILRDGAVRLVGLVPNAEEQKRIENIVQQVPGVVRVYDALQIGVQAAPGQPSPAPPAQNQK